MSVRHMGLVLDHYNGPPHLKLLLLILADHADGDTGECFPSYATLAARACCSKRTAITNVGELIASGYVEVAEQGGRIWHHKTARYVNAPNVFRVVAESLRGMPNLREQARRTARGSIHNEPVDSALGFTPGGEVGFTPVVREGGEAHFTRTVIRNHQDITVSAVESVDNLIDGLAKQWSM